MGQYTSTRAYWFKIDTNTMDGGVAQMVVGSANGQTFACYVTTAGSVYCGGPTTRTPNVAGEDFPYTSHDDATNTYYYDYGVSSWIEYVAPTTKEQHAANALAYDAVVAKENKTNFMGQYTSTRAYWFKIDTTGMDSSSTTAGTTITLTGKNLSKVTNVYIDTNNNSALDEGTDIAVSNLKIISDTELTFTAPSMSPGTYNLIITNPGNVVVKGTLTYR